MPTPRPVVDSTFDQRTQKQAGRLPGGCLHSGFRCGLPVCQRMGHGDTLIKRPAYEDLGGGRFETCPECT